MRLRKVIAYIVREAEGKRQLLVFTHRDYPDAGLQVPAGTIEEGEEIETGLRREVAEETERHDFEVVGEVGSYDWTHPVTGNVHERHVFLMTAPSTTPDAWEWVETDGGMKSELKGYVFCFRWDDLEGEIELAGGQVISLPTIR